MEIGTLCIKTCGREKGKKCVVVDIVDRNFVMIDGNVKRRKCNVEHLTALNEKIELHKGASTSEVKSIFDKHGLAEKPREIAVANKRERKGRQEQKATEKPKKEKKASPKKTSDSSERQMRSSAENEDEIVEAALDSAES